jgi:HAD superfamily hydrolase (TIGR01509 family)
MRTLRGWVFDLDGTLTVAQHDFDGIKRRLGLDPALPVLEGVALRPEAERPAILAAIHDWELGLARQARPNPGARALLEHLRATGCALGLLTRNSRDNAAITLEAAGLLDLFDPDHLIGRDEQPPKPAPDGVLHLARRWGLPTSALAMVGDWSFDLQAGRAAGARSVWLDVDRTGIFDHLADRVVQSLAELLEWDG